MKWLYCVPETNTISQIKYTLIFFKKKKKKLYLGNTHTKSSQEQLQESLFMITEQASPSKWIARKYCYIHVLLTSKVNVCILNASSFKKKKGTDKLYLES